MQRSNITESRENFRRFAYLLKINFIYDLCRPVASLRNEDRIDIRTSKHLIDVIRSLLLACSRKPFFQIYIHAHFNTIPESFEIFLCSRHFTSCRRRTGR